MAIKMRRVCGLALLAAVLLVGGGCLPTDRPPTEPAGESSGAWMQLFEPADIEISYFTQSRNFDDKEGDDGLEIRVQALDRFGDPTKAVGNWRFEVFQYRERSLERHGGRLCHWYVSMMTPEENKRYYDNIDRSYRFPLLWDAAIPPGTRVVVQATFYPPEEEGRKLVAERIIWIGK